MPNSSDKFHVSTDETNRLILYSNLMEEVKSRQAVINTAGSGKLSDLLPSRAVEELCYLQLRMICELIALSCLIVHGDIEATQTSKMQKKYEADWLLNALSQLHENFYPRPSRQILDEKTGRPVNVEPITSGYLTRDKLKMLYHECGDVLHRGNAASVTVGKVRPLDFDRIGMWSSEIVTLLNHHQIEVVGGAGREYWVLMQAKEDNKVHWTVMQKVEGAPPAGA